MLNVMKLSVMSSPVYCQYYKTKIWLNIFGHKSISLLGSSAPTTSTGQTEEHKIRHVFVMTGANPNTGWLNGCVALDAKGFIKTGPDLSPENLSAARWPLARQPYLLETSLPGVFAVGDVRGGSIKRVASAVGEGSIAISLVHKVLQE